MHIKLFLTVLVALIVSVSPVLAQSYETIAINDIADVAHGICPRPITPRQVSIIITNLRADADTYQVDIEIPNGWDKQYLPKDDITLDPGESEELQFIVTPYQRLPSEVEPGIYTLIINAESLTRGETFTKELYVEILSCYVVDLDIAEKEKEVCEESGEAVIFEIDVTNKGKGADTFDLSASVDWASLPDSVTLEPEETETINLVLNPPEDLLGLQTVTVTAQSEAASYARDTGDVKLNILNCYDFDASIQPSESKACLGRSVRFYLNIENTGMEKDEYTITAPGWVSLEKTLMLEAGVLKVIEIAATPEQLGVSVFELSVSSENEETKTVSATVNTEECRDVVVIVSPSEVTTCSGLPAGFDVTVKNRGTVVDTFDLAATMGSLEKTKVDLKPGESETVKLDIDTTGMTGIYTVEIVASSDEVSDMSTVTLITEDCYSAELNITPESHTTCPLTQVNYTVILKNTGKLNDTYTLKFEDVTQKITLGPGESQTFSFPAYAEESGAYVINVSAMSDHVSSEAQTVLIVKTAEQCFSLQITGDKTVAVELYKAVALTINIKNTGENPDTYKLSVQGPEWTYLSPESLSLEPGEEGNVYLYLSPSQESDTGTHTLVISAGSPNAQAEHHIAVGVATDITDLNVTTPGPEDNVTENITTGNVTLTLGNITGALIEEGERPLWKTIVVAVITIIIIIILIIRFVILVK
jgi:uncharacterized membrane protein